MSEDSYFSRRVENANSELHDALCRLKPDQGRVARRNARRAVLGALRQVRNAINLDFPRLEKPTTDEGTYLVDIFEPAHREGRRLLNDRWRVIRGKDLAYFTRYPHVAFSGEMKHWGDGKEVRRWGTMLPTDAKSALRFAKWCKNHFPHTTFRLRKVGTRDVTIGADIL